MTEDEVSTSSSKIGTAVGSFNELLADEFAICILMWKGGQK